MNLTLFVYGRRYASFFFGWELDRERTRIIFYTVLDVEGRNIMPFGKSHKRYNRWIEEGYSNELMRYTDVVNSLPLNKRQRMTALTRLGLLKPSEQLMIDLWDLVKERLAMNHFIRKWGG